MGIIDFKGVPVLVTGGAGFIGSHLTDELLRRGAKVRVLDNFATGYRENLSQCLDQIELIEGDIRDAKTCQQACDGVSYVFHQAALGSVPRSMDDPATSLAVNAMGTANMFAGARDANVKRVVYASSSSVYGDSETLPKKEGQEGKPMSPYALSKWMNEELADIFARCYGMQLVGLRYFNVYGQRQDPTGPYAAVIPKFFAAVAAGKAPVIYGDGTQSRDFTFIKDVVEANLRAASSQTLPSDAPAYNIGAAGRITINDLAEAICKIMDSPLKAEHGDPRPGDVAHSRADISAAKRDLGYDPRVELDEGIGLTKPA